jgi:hypothetical protein
LPATSTLPLASIFTLETWPVCGPPRRRDQVETPADVNLPIADVVAAEDRQAAAAEVEHVVRVDADDDRPRPSRRPRPSHRRRR